MHHSYFYVGICTSDASQCEKLGDKQKLDKFKLLKLK